MTKRTVTYRLITTLLLCALQAAGVSLYAQKAKEVKQNIPKARQHRMKDRLSFGNDSIPADSLAKLNAENYEFMEAPVDTAELMTQKDSAMSKPAKEKNYWLPNSGRATWLATIIPGGGQIYNRKFWKLPIIYGGFAACAYALSWNNQMYSDYSQAYLDILDNNPNTKSYLDFIAPGSSFNEEQLKNILKSRKDLYRRNRDLSIFAFIGVYLISIIDAYVDAELSNFDISKDLSLKLEPAVINDYRGRGNFLGLQCSIKF